MPELDKALGHTMTPAKKLQFVLAIMITITVLLTQSCRLFSSYDRVAVSVRPGQYTARHVWLEPTGAYGGGIWFPDELELLNDAIAEVLARPAYRFTVLPSAAIRREWEQIRLGKLPGRSGTCPAPPPPSRLTAYLYRGASQVESDVRCKDGKCTLKVLVRRNDQPKVSYHERVIARYEVPLPPESPAAWAAQIRRDGLTPIPPPPDEGLSGSFLVTGIAGLGTQGKRVDGINFWVDSLTTSGNWAYRLTEKHFLPVVRDLAACKKPGMVWRDWFGQPFYIEVNQEGLVTRCSDGLPQRLTPPWFACQCDVLSRLSFSQGASERRARFSLYVSRPSVRRKVRADGLLRYASLVDFKADDRSAILGTRFVDSDALTPCLDGVMDPLGELKVPVSWRVDGQGRVLNLAIHWPEVLPSAVTSCMERVLKMAQFNCPLSRAAQVRANLKFQIRRSKDVKLLKPSKVKPKIEAP